MSDMKLSKHILKTAKNYYKAKLTTWNWLSFCSLTWFTLITPPPLALRQTDTLPRKVVTSCSCQRAQSVTVAGLAAAGVAHAEVVRLRHALTAPGASHTSFARTLSCRFVTKQRAIYCPCLLAVTWQTKEGVTLLHSVVPIQALIAAPSPNIWFTCTLPRPCVTRGSRNGPCSITFTSLTTSYIQPIKVVHAGVTEKPFHSFFTIALSGQRVAELAHWAVAVAPTRLTSIFIRISESFKSKIAAITPQAWKEKRN